MTEGNGKTELNAMEELLAAAALIQAAEYVCDNQPPSAHNRVIGDGTQILKQLCTLRSRIRKDAEPDMHERKGIEHELQTAMGSIFDIAGHIEYLDLPAVRAKITRLKELSTSAARTQVRLTLIDAMIAAETTRLFPEVVGKPFSFDNMWRVFVRDAVPELAESAHRVAQAAISELLTGQQQMPEV